MWSYIITSRTRQLVEVCRHYGVVILAICIMAILSIEALSTGLQIVSRYNYLAQAIIVASFFYLGIFRKYPLIAINPVYIVFLRGSHFIKKLIIAKILLVVIELLIFVLILKLVFSASLSFFVVAAYFSGLIACGIIGWSRYNNQAKKSLVFLGILLLSLCTFAPLSLLVVSLALSIILLVNFPIVNWDKYLHDMNMIYKTQSAFARMDFAKMQALAQSCLVERKYFFPYKTIGNNPLLGKSLYIDIFRSSRNSYILSIVCWLLSLILLPGYISFDYFQLVSMLLMISAIAALSNEQAMHARVMQLKISQGFYIPYGKAELSLWNVVAAFFVLAIMCLTVAMVGNLNLLVSLVALVLLGCILFLNSYCSMKWPKLDALTRIVNLVANASIVVSWWIVA